MDEKQLTLADVAEGLTAVISLHMPTPRFGDATLKQLCNDEIELHIQNVIETRLLQFLEQNKNAAHLIIQRMREAAQQRIQKLEEIAHSKISNSRLDLQNAATIAPCKSKLASDSELFIVLRDSCYTAAVNGRNPEFQAILPLERNIFAETEAATQNLQFISNCLGRIDELHELTINELRFQKIIIMLDEEDNPILRSLTKFFLNNHPLLIQEGLLYRAIPPRFKISKLKKTVYCFKDLRKEKFLEEFGGGATVDELRLGTLEARELWQTTMNPDARVLRQITNPDLVT
jgi:DNA gyrase subunit B